MEHHGSFFALFPDSDGFVKGGREESVQRGTVLERQDSALVSSQSLDQSTFGLLVIPQLDTGIYTSCGQVFPFRQVHFHHTSDFSFMSIFLPLFYFHFVTSTIHQVHFFFFPLLTTHSHQLPI